MSTTWKSKASLNQRIVDDPEDDDWETDGNFENDVTEQQQRWGSKTVAGSGRIVENIDFQKVIEEIQIEDKKAKEQFVHESQTDVTKGFGGKFGVQSDRVDQSALGWDYHEKLEQHQSQKDYSKGFGGKFGVEKDKMDKSAVSWDYHTELNKHESQKDHSKGFGGKFGVQSDRVDQSAVDWDYHEKLEQHQSQKDYSKGFGGKFGVEKDKMDKSAVSWDHHEKLESHKTDKPISVGKIKVPDFNEHHDSSDRATIEKPVITGKINVPNFVEKQKLAEATNKPTPTGKIKLPATFTQSEESEKTPAKSNNPVHKGSAGALKSKFENLIKESDSENQRKIEEERLRRLEKEKNEKNKAKREEEERQKKLRLEAEQRRLSESGEPQNDDEASSSDEQVVSSKVNKIGISVLPTQGLIKQNSKASNRSSSYDSDIEKDLNDVETNITPINSGEQANTVDIEQRTNEAKKIVIEQELEKVNCQKEIELQRELEEEELRRKLAEDDESLIEEDASEEKEIRAVALYDYEAAESFLPGDIIGNIEKVDSGWWRGSVVGGDGKVGLFPSNYVEQLDS